MSSRELENLVDRGLLKREPGDQQEFDGLVASGRKRLADAKKSELAAESKFDLAYNAAHAFALAAMRWRGYRPDNRRYIVFQALSQTLGIKPEIWRVLDKCHGRRNMLEYDGTFDVDRQLLADLVSAAEILDAAINRLGPVGGA
jgi:hypothetical protein